MVEKRDGWGTKGTAERAATGEGGECYVAAQQRKMNSKSCHECHRCV
mgnify:CR=1 FL=1